MTDFLVDTNVISELARPKPNTAAISWLSSLDHLWFSVITLDELSYGIERAPERNQQRLRSWMSDLLNTRPTIVEVSSQIALTAGRLRAQRESNGRRVAQSDMLIAACALDRGLVLATRNTKDFDGCGLDVFNPFEQN
jgi:toxin FitB